MSENNAVSLTGLFKQNKKLIGYALAGMAALGTMFYYTDESKVISEVNTKTIVNQKGDTLIKQTEVHSDLHKPRMGY